ncbi:MAG: SDR family oxidoreductase [Paraburkholderia tropica]|uniref:Gluconate 5-dehydrogenase n=1 Tax=Paraburkholderia tropica TaxID=92647 RepID=A0ABX5MKN4_9BURK|nr:SDR family oxidoreductase [Paraburkholderia tropica]PXX12524.1 gluconate 5-dehydrogenase [Paraburkholderia tropica]PZW76501.1 gluconate 5-dehydrogenase [Paraburkholderia tropica]
MTFDGFDLSGKVAVVTGAAQGIGKALAIGLAQAGATVAVTDRPDMDSRMCDVQAQIESTGGIARTYHLDVTATRCISSVFERIATDLGHLDILVNNAGTGIACAAIDVTEEEWDRILDLNLKGQFFCAQAAARLMATQGGGRIINVASTHALIALPDGAPYIASKGGVASLTRSLALEWIRLGINVNAIAPGPVETEYKREVDVRLGRTPESIRLDMERRVPLARRLDPAELVGGVIYLASPSAAAVVGHMLVVDGGQIIH